MKSISLSRTGAALIRAARGRSKRSKEDARPVQIGRGKQMTQCQLVSAKVLEDSVKQTYVLKSKF